MMSRCRAGGSANTDVRSPPPLAVSHPTLSENAGAWNLSSWPEPSWLLTTSSETFTLCITPRFSIPAENDRTCPRHDLQPKEFGNFRLSVSICQAEHSHRQITHTCGVGHCNPRSFFANLLVQSPLFIDTINDGDHVEMAGVRSEPWHESNN